MGGASEVERYLMGARNHVRVQTSLLECRAVARWLEQVETVGLDQYNLFAIFRKAGERKRPARVFSIRLHRDQAAWLSSAGEHFPQMGVLIFALKQAPPPLALLPFLKRCGQAAKSRRGNRSLITAALERRAKGQFYVSDRQKQRSAGRLRYNQQLENWISDGNTILGDGPPPPKNVT